MRLVNLNHQDTSSLIVRKELDRGVAWDMTLTELMIDMINQSEI